MVGSRGLGCARRRGSGSGAHEVGGRAMPGVGGRGRASPAVGRRHQPCNRTSMAARCLEDLRVWQKARVLTAEISATLKQPSLRNSWALRDQLDRASLSIAANIAEGFAQQSDRAFARYLFLARASASEVRALLEVGHDQEKLTTAQRRRLLGRCNEVSRMLNALIRYLVDADRRTRQLGQ